MPMLERIAGNRELKQDLKTALGSGRIAHSILLVGEPGCGAGFAARCLAADYLYPNGGPHAEAVLRGQDTESIVVRGEGLPARSRWKPSGMRGRISRNQPFLRMQRAGCCLFMARRT